MNMRRKLVCGLLVNSQIFYFWSIVFTRILALVVLPFALAFGGSLTLALPAPLMQLSEQVTEKSMALDYDGAMALAKKVRGSDDGVGCVLENIVRVSRYDDLGDTVALQKAGVNLEKCASTGLWEALRKFELGYVQSESGHSVKGAMTTRSAAKLFEESPEQEARAFYAIYAYYIDKSFSWVPFKSDRRSEYLAVLDSVATGSKRFWPLYLTSLVWMHYDKGDFNAGLKLTLRGLGKVPNHPVLLQVKADMLYRLKRYKEAAAIYEKSAADYLTRTGKSIRYWCAVMNLVRIYADMGDKAKMQAWRERLNDDTFKKMKDWMPGSLTDDLDKRDLLD